MQVCFFSILKCKVLMRIEFKLGVSMLQSRCNLEIFGKVFDGSKNFFLGNIDITVIMATPVAHCSNFTERMKLL